jgi:hypothetical protein
VLHCGIGGTLIMRNFGIPQTPSATRILLVCPDCGERNPEPADRLRGMRTYCCAGDGCDYIFDLAPGRPLEFGGGFIEACKRFYASFYVVRGQRAR